MVMIELRDNAYDAAFELLDEAKHSAKKTKLTLCELEDAMYECYEASKENEDEHDDEELNLRDRYDRRYNYRHEEDHDKHDDEDDDIHYSMRRTGRRGMRMRRNHMGRFV